MKFQAAVEETPQVKDAYCAGLKALRNPDKPRIMATDTRRLCGSVDLDSAVKNLFADSPRWDYAVGFRRTLNKPEETVYWVKIHPANDNEIKAVLAKLEWLLLWMKDHAPKLKAMPREFIWLSSGKTSFTPSAPQRKQFALKGLQHRGRVLKLV